MDKRTFIGLTIVTACALGLVILAGCGDPSGATEPSAPKPTLTKVAELEDGQVGSHDVSKFCDGTTLVYLYDTYREGGIAVIPNSWECRDHGKDELS